MRIYPEEDKGTIGGIQGLYRDNGKENGNYYLGFRVCRPMIDKTPPVRGLVIRIPRIIPIKGREFIKQGSGLT